MAISIKTKDPKCPKHSKRISGATCTCLRICNLCRGEFTGKEHETWACVRTFKDRAKAKGRI